LGGVLPTSATQSSVAQKKIKENMNIKILVLGAVLTTLAGSTFAAGALLSPRAQGNQIKVAATSDASAVTTLAYVDSVTPLSPRLAAAQTKVVKGLDNDRNPKLECLRTMNGTPKAVGACIQSTTMPGCR
jgi:hypothetical protein